MQEKLSKKLTGRHRTQNERGERSLLFGRIALKSKIKIKQSLGDKGLHRGNSKGKIEPSKWTWGIRWATHKFHFRQRHFDRLEIHLQGHSRMNNNNDRHGEDDTSGSREKWFRLELAKHWVSMDRVRMMSVVPCSHGGGPGVLRLVASVEVVVGLVPVTRRGHGLATTVACSSALGEVLCGHAGSAKVVGLRVPASASRGRTYQVSC